MGCPAEVEIGDSLVFSVTTHDSLTGALTDADSVPTYRVYEDEDALPILTGSMAKLDDVNTTGFYTEEIDCTAGNGFENGKTYTIYIEAEVDGVEGGLSCGFKSYDLRKANATQISDSKATADAVESNIGNLDAAVSARAAASVCTEARLGELDAANVPADIDTLIARLTAARAGYLDNLNGHTPQSGNGYPIVSDAAHGNAALKALIDALENLSAAEVYAALASALDDPIPESPTVDSINEQVTKLGVMESVLSRVYQRLSVGYLRGLAARIFPGRRY